MAVASVEYRLEFGTFQGHEAVFAMNFKLYVPLNSKQKP